MPGLDRQLVEHKLPIKDGYLPVKQARRRMSMDTELKVKEEIERLLKAGFIRPAIYADWLANIVPVLKRKTGAVRICVDYRNLNEASPKDEYPMPMEDMLIDGAAHNQMLSFMDEFTLRYVPQKAVKGQAVADFLADHPGEEIENMDSLDIANANLLTRAHVCLNNPIYSIHLTPWKLYFDGSKTDKASGAGVVLEEPLGIRHCYSFQLDFQCTNNRAEYEALIIGLEMLVELGVQSVEILGDSMLVLKQIAGEYKCLNPSLAVYLVAARNLLTEFREATWEHIPREENFAANELAQVASGIQMPEDCVQRIIKIGRKSLPSILTRGMEI
ncbi:hypothetical protein L3X38_045436 [Prunus dulcis]|uniref:RNase H type-1 domain-containing protein n=1 Tax=Prunus dulcis TaxID=3755 RepID=A0AAD4V0D1_PRUDU|nr:hypothetical protein L3X38_045436 [Prunus dulcis]